MKFKASRRDWVYTYAPVFLWIGLILFLGSGSGSMSETSRIIGPLIQFFFPGAGPDFVKTFHGLVRKAAHVAEYAILAALAARVALRIGSDWSRRNWPLPVLGLVSLIASLDEFNQSFNSQRTGSPWDVLLDISGGALAIALIWLYRRRTESEPPA